MSEETTSRSRFDQWYDAQADHLKRVVKIAYPPLLVGAALFGYFNQPIVRFVDPVDVYAFSFILVTTMLVSTFAVSLGRDLFGLTIGVLGICGGSALLLGEFDEASKRAEINDQRCVAIEQEMLTPAPRLENLPELFAALGCRPQTNIILKFEKRGGDTLRRGR